MYANAPRARARAVKVKGLKKNLRRMLLSDARIVVSGQRKAYSTLVSMVSWKGSILVYGSVLSAWMPSQVMKSRLMRMANSHHTLDEDGSTVLDPNHLKHIHRTGTPCRPGTGSGSASGCETIESDSSPGEVAS